MPPCFHDGSVWSLPVGWDNPAGPVQVLEFGRPVQATLIYYENNGSATLTDWSTADTPTGSASTCCSNKCRYAEFPVTFPGPY